MSRRGVTVTVMVAAVRCLYQTNPLTNKQTFMQVLLAKHKADGSFYAVKVLQKKVILKKKEVGETTKKNNVFLHAF